MIWLKLPADDRSLSAGLPIRELAGGGRARRPDA